MTLLERCRGDNYIAQRILAQLDRDSRASFRESCAEHRAMLAPARMYAPEMSCALYASAMRDGNIELMRATSRVWMPECVASLCSDGYITDANRHLRESFCNWFVAIFGYGQFIEELALYDRVDGVPNAILGNVKLSVIPASLLVMHQARKCPYDPIFMRSCTDDMIGARILLTYMQGKYCATCSDISQAIDLRFHSDTFMMAFAIGLCDHNRARTLDVRRDVFAKLVSSLVLRQDTRSFSARYVEYLVLPRYELMFRAIFGAMDDARLWSRILYDEYYSRDSLRNDYAGVAAQILMRGNVSLTREIISYARESIDCDHIAQCIRLSLCGAINVQTCGAATCNEILSGAFSIAECLREVLQFIREYDRASIDSIASQLLDRDKLILRSYLDCTMESCDRSLSARLLEIHCGNIAAQDHTTLRDDALWESIIEVIARDTLSMNCAVGNSFDFASNVSYWTHHEEIAQTVFAQMSIVARMIILVAREHHMKTTSRAIIAVILLSSYDDERVARDAARVVNIDFDAQLDRFMQGIRTQSAVFG